MTAKPVKTATNKILLRDIRGLIEQTRSAVAVTVNAGLTMLNWHIGQRINAEILKGKRAGYGDEIVAALGRQLAERNKEKMNRHVNAIAGRLSLRPPMSPRLYAAVLYRHLWKS